MRLSKEQPVGEPLHGLQPVPRGGDAADVWEECGKEDQRRGKEHAEGDDGSLFRFSAARQKKKTAARMMKGTEGK